MIPFIPFFLIQLWISFHTPIDTPRRVMVITPIENRSVLESVRAEHKVKTGFVCYSNMDIQCIDDICQDTTKHLYWSININDDYSKVNSMTPLKAGDSVKLEYASLKEK